MIPCALGSVPREGCALDQALFLETKRLFPETPAQVSQGWESTASSLPGSPGRRKGLPVGLECAGDEGLSPSNKQWPGAGSLTSGLSSTGWGRGERGRWEVGGGPEGTLFLTSAH